MERSLFKWSLTFAAALVFSISGFAQHGGAGMGGGRPAGAGPGVGGPPSGVGTESSGRPGDIGSTGVGHSNMNMGSQSPSSVLDNGKLDTALTNALAKSGISVPGGNLKSACSEFKTLGQCIAALHVAKNLNLSFSDLQSKMGGTKAESLGKAIQDLGGPNVNAKSEAKKANKQANRDLNAAQAAS